MPAPSPDHRHVIEQEFSHQAPLYAANSLISDPARVARLVSAVAPAPTARVLEVATGPGYVALGFGAICREVVGIDLTPAQLAIAEQLRDERGRGTCASRWATPKLPASR